MSDTLIHNMGREGCLYYTPATTYITSAYQSGRNMIVININRIEIVRSKIKVTTYTVHTGHCTVHKLYNPGPNFRNTLGVKTVVTFKTTHVPNTAMNRSRTNKYLLCLRFVLKNIVTFKPKQQLCCLCKSFFSHETDRYISCSCVSVLELLNMPNNRQLHRAESMLLTFGEAPESFNSIIVIK